MAARINLAGNGFSLSGLKGGFLVALYQMTSGTGRWTLGLIDTGFFWQWWSWYSHSSMYVIYQLTFFCLWEQRGRPARRQILWEDSTGAFQLYPERYLVATTVNPGSDKWMKRNSNNRRSFYVSPWFFYLYLDLFHLVPTFSPLDMSSYRKVICFKYSLLLTFF